MVQFRRSSNDGKTLAQTVFFSTLTIVFLVAGLLTHPRPFCWAIFLLGGVFSAGVVRGITTLVRPFEYVCEFDSDEVRWWESHKPDAVSSIALNDIMEVHVNFDDHQLCFNTGGTISRGIGADIEMSDNNLRAIADFCQREWKSVIVYVIRRGESGGI